jgi:hypothetical protein
MTLQLCIPRCAHTVRRRADVRMPSCRTVVFCHKCDPRCAGNTPRCGVGAEDPLENGNDWEDGADWDSSEFDPTPLESWILDDFEWDIEPSYPERGDYWDDSLDGEWDRAGCAAITNDEGANVADPPRRGETSPNDECRTGHANHKLETRNPKMRFSLCFLRRLLPKSSACLRWVTRAARSRS